VFCRINVPRSMLVRKTCCLRIRHGIRHACSGLLLMMSLHAVTSQVDLDFLQTIDGVLMKISPGYDLTKEALEKLSTIPRCYPHQIWCVKDWFTVLGYLPVHQCSCNGDGRYLLNVVGCCEDCPFTQYRDLEMQWGKAGCSRRWAMAKV
jgi:hypothetical protein